MSRHGVCGARAWFAGTTFVAVLLGASLAGAHTSSDWDKIKAEINTLPPGFGNGTIPQPVLDSIHQNIQAAPNAPGSWTIVRGGASPSIVSATRKPDGTIVEVDNGIHPTSIVLDPLGVVELSHFQVWGTNNAVAALSLSGALASHLSSVPLNMKVHGLHVLDNSINGSDGGILVNIMDQDCQILPTPSNTLAEHCGVSYRAAGWHLDDSINVDSSNLRPDDRIYEFDPRFGIFFLKSDTDNVIDWKVGDIVDWKVGDHPWHSVVVSAQLAPAQKEQARALFQRGFDLFKSGDFTGAEAMVEAGLKIDPGNHLAWFTLGQINHSIFETNTSSTDGQAAALTYYQHTIDLAPDSPEAILAKGYLAK